MCVSLLVERFFCTVNCSQSPKGEFMKKYSLPQRLCFSPAEILQRYTFLVLNSFGQQTEFQKTRADTECIYSSRVTHVISIIHEPSSFSPNFQKRHN